MRNLTCRMCEHWAVSKNLEMGECRASLPITQVIQVAEGFRAYALFPAIHHSKWCAEGKPRLDVEKK